MSTSTAPTVLPSLQKARVGVPPAIAAGISAAVVVFGVASIASTLLLLWALWTTDALKSIGMVVPVVSFLLVLRAWRALNWELNGTWWGYAVLVATAFIVRVREQTVMMLVLSPKWTLFFPPHSLVMVAYGVGAVLLFGGVRLLRRSIFPVMLLALVNPVPHVFNLYVDLPLQRASAHIARAFAMALGQPLSPDKLRLMFTPEFGMFIAPGCNGIRGAITMGFIAMVAGYLYRFRLQSYALVVAGALLLGYVFNFVRLCVLVLFYIVALKVPVLQDHAENADYIIGAVLFFLGVYLLSIAIARLGRRTVADDGTESVLWLPRTNDSTSVKSSRSFPLRALAMLVLAALGMMNLVHLLTAPAVSAATQQDSALGEYPQTAGEYTLVRRWNESLLTGAVLFHWAEYAPAGGGTHISLGISTLGAHDTLLCHAARGEDPLWHGQSNFITPGGPVAFNTSFYNDGATQSLEATTLCNGATCGEYATPQTHLGFIYSRPNASSFLSHNPERPIPLLFKAETIDTTLPADAARAALEHDLSTFLAGMPLDALTRPYRR